MLNDNIGDTGAGQPLHRDLGMFSINIALSDRNSFKGGGTFFQDFQKVYHPIGRGFGLGHLSSTRHAGAGTTDGVRDILVFFVTASPLMSVESAMRCKGVMNSFSFSSEKCYKAAIDMNPLDSEAWQFFGTSTLDSLPKVTNENLSEVIKLLEKAESLSPNDARVHNNLGLILQKQLPFIESNEDKSKIRSKIESHFKRALEILEVSSSSGCDVHFEECSVRLNLGLWLSYDDKWEEVINILRAPCLKRNGLSEQHATNTERIKRDALGLMKFCEKKFNALQAVVDV